MPNHIHLLLKMTLPLLHPFSAIVAGPSQAGKSVWVANLLSCRDKMISPPPEKIYVCYKEYQPLYDTFKGVTFHEGMINIDELDKSVRKLIIYDDMMEQVNSEMSEVFTKFVHHRNLSVVFLTQNLFHKSQHIRTMNLNSNYLVLFRNPRDINQVQFLARQMYPPGQTKAMSDAFKDATSIPYGYLFIDLKQNTPDFLRLRTSIFSDNKCYIYIPKATSYSFERYTSCDTDHDKES